MPVSLSAASVSPLTDWFFSLIWSAVATGLPLFVIVLFVPMIFIETTARSVVVAFTVLYTGALIFSVLIIIFMMRSSAGGVMTYPAALSQMGLTYLAARVVNDIVKGTYVQDWFVRLYYHLGNRYFGLNDPYAQPVPVVRNETAGIDETDPISPAHAPVAALRGRHAAPASNRSAA